MTSTSPDASKPTDPSLGTESPAEGEPSVSPDEKIGPGTKPAPKRRWRRRLIRAGVVTLIITLAIAALSQVFIPVSNPDFPLSRGEAHAEIAAMRAEPVSLTRPVVFVTGWRSPPVNGEGLARQIRLATNAGDDDLLVWSDALAGDINVAAGDLVDLVEATWPSDPGASTTVEVDVIAISMGGLVSRTAARPSDERDGSPGEKRLAIRNLYTFGSPHDGARLSQLFRVDTASSQMEPGSDFMASLNAGFDDAGYTLTPYAALHDRWVGATRSAPPGMDPIWVSGRAVLSHHLITNDPRLVADLLRRLRGEDAYGSASEPPRD
jgi:hypothetical protein